MVGPPVTQCRLKRIFLNYENNLSACWKANTGSFLIPVFVMHRQSRSIVCSERNALLNGCILQSSYALNVKTTTHPHS